MRLKRCNVSFNGFDSDGGKLLADVIKNNTTLEHFNVSNTRLNAECAASIANALEQNENLKSLNVKIKFSLLIFCQINNINSKIKDVKQSDHDFRCSGNYLRY